jgi:intracellular sulfur oxidation DsrE/DsrF family protein
MNCSDATRIVNAYADGELDLAMALEVEAHLGSCARCRGSFAALQAVRGAIGRHCAFEPAPEALRSGIRAGLTPRREGRLQTLLRSPFAVAAPGLLALALAAWLLAADLMKGASRFEATQLRVVYHISSSDTAGAALRNLANHLQAVPDAKIVVVAHNNGVDFLLHGARDETNHPYAAAVRDFRRRGVEFRVCYNTLERRRIPASELIPEATLVPSGIAEIGRLQSREGYAYMRL